MFCFTSYLMTSISGSLQDVYSFMRTVDVGLDGFSAEEGVEPPKEDLMAVMTHIRDVRKKMDYMTTVFTPLRDMVMLLKTHGIPLDLGYIGNEKGVIPMSALDFLESAPLAWDNIVNKTFRVKEEIQPMQNKMVESIKSEANAFTKKVTGFVASYRKTGPYDWSTDKVVAAYKSLDACEVALSEIEKEAVAFGNLQELFELNTSQQGGLEQQRLELTLLKQVWDTIGLMLGLFEAWKQTLWDEIDTEYLMDEAKALSTTIKRLPRRVREWPVYKTLTGEAHNISVVLPLVAELSSPAMRARHWSSLAAVCRRTIDKGPHFAFEDLLALELHNYVDGVGEIVETAQKEEKVERKLKAIENSWTAMRLEFIQHRDSDVQIVAPSDEMMEILEENQMQLQSMVSMGRSVEFFRAQIGRASCRERV